MFIKHLKNVKYSLRPKIFIENVDSVSEIENFVLENVYQAFKKSKMCIEFFYHVLENSELVFETC